VLVVCRSSVVGVGVQTIVAHWAQGRLCENRSAVVVAVRVPGAQGASRGRGRAKPREVESQRQVARGGERGDGVGRVCVSSPRGRERERGEIQRAAAASLSLLFFGR
jgi:hypothetical protein